MIDPIAKAYATIGVPRGASARDLKTQYKRLVRQWHPDRWTNDPAGQAEASVRMRAINDAYATLYRLVPPEPHAGARVQRSLTKEELDALVQAIGTESQISGVIRMLVWVMPLVAFFFLLLLQRAR